MFELTDEMLGRVAARLGWDTQWCDDQCTDGSCDHQVLALVVRAFRTLSAEAKEAAEEAGWAFGDVSGHSWTGCPAQFACLHHLEDRTGRVTALCRACGDAYAAFRSADREGVRCPNRS